MKRSIAMAAYNGSEFISEQIESILSQLDINDELVISLDASQDNTQDIINYYVSIDNRVKLVHNELSGVVKNFENAIRNCNGDIIFLSDQDDVWLDGKISKVTNEFLDNENTLAVIHDYKLVNEDLSLISDSGFELRGGASASVIGNIYRLRYIGCCMAFRKEVVSFILPIPTKKRSHDWWIGTIVGMHGKVKVLNDKLILHRMHGNNATPKKRQSLSYMIAIRFLIIRKVLFRYFKLKCYGSI
ncbi:TPA: glycosyltransferase [Vibrio vulnificus]|nr:glycosyltransferase [Vibrio vulnificus]